MIQAAELLQKTSSKIHKSLFIAVIVGAVMLNQYSLLLAIAYAAVFLALYLLILIKFK